MTRTLALTALLSFALLAKPVSAQPCACQGAEGAAPAGPVSGSFGSAVSLGFMSAYAADWARNGHGRVEEYIRDDSELLHVAEIWGEGIEADDRFGWSMATAAKFHVIGAPGDDDAGLDAGAVYLRPDVQWEGPERAKLTAPDASESDAFGIDVATDAISIAVISRRRGYVFRPDEENPDGWIVAARLETPILPGSQATIGIYLDTVVIGSAADVGAAWVFRDDGSDAWPLVATLGTDDPEVGDFGRDVAIFAGIVAVGADDWTDRTAPHTSSCAALPGDWAQVRKLTGAVGTDAFGTSADVDGDYLAVGADGGSSTGRVFVFYRDYPAPGAWGEVKSLAGGTEAPLDRFGSDVALDGNYLAIGAPGDPLSLATPSVHVYRRGFEPAGWARVAVLVDPEAEPQDRFGAAVALAGTRLLAGVEGDTASGFEAGSALLFERGDEINDWSLTTRLIPAGTHAEDHAGASVSIDGRDAVVGVPGADDAGASSGRLSVFPFGACLAPCATDLSGDGVTFFEDLLRILSYWGPCLDCPEDLDGDGTVGFTDLVAVLSAWGPCPV